MICSLFDGSQVKREHIRKGICTFLYNQENLIFALQETSVYRGFPYALSDFVQRLQNQSLITTPF